MAIMQYYKGLSLYLEHKYIMAKFDLPHLVLSTCRVNGGVQDNIEALCNVQVCEAVGHMPKSLAEYADAQIYLEQITSLYNLPLKSALLCTAANMQCAGMAQEFYEDLQVLAVVTAGVEGNAVRAGDLASYAETAQGIINLDNSSKITQNKVITQDNTENCKTKHGTINMMLFVNKPLSFGAMTQALITVTEAKSAILQEYGVTSLYSKQIATGTGTDQMGIACLEHKNLKPLSDAGKHSKLGEMLAKASLNALRDSLSFQNSLNPKACATLDHLLKRWHKNIDHVLAQAKQDLNTEDFQLFMQNISSINHSPSVVTAVASFLHVYEQVSWKCLPNLYNSNIVLAHAGFIACSASGKNAKLEEYCQKIEIYMSKNNENMQKCPFELSEIFFAYMAKALSLGFMDKW